ncbi:MAG: branched-chain amino acid ABC transporter permease [Clostridiales bacterium]|jgi:branched-chain amino acid transport system permease protein|nr:branched-chain amino acid ABC transporter permease [Clostridiales bacterium]
MSVLLKKFKMQPGQSPAPAPKKATPIGKFFRHPYSHFMIFGVLLVLVQVLAMTGVLSAALARSVGVSLIYSIASLGFCLLLGYSGLASLGTAGFMGLGGYMFAYLLAHTPLPFFICVAVSVAALILIGALVGFISLRIEGIYLAIVTLGLSEILVSFFKAFDSFTGGASGVNLKAKDLVFMFGAFELSREVSFFIITAALVGLMIVTANLINSPTGRAMLAMKNSTSAAQAMGISKVKIRLLAFVLATCYAGIAGILYAVYIRSMNPSVWSLSLSLNILAAIILGGARSIWGTLVGAFLVFGINTMFLQDIAFFRDNPNFIMIFIGILIILIVMLYPGGLAQLAKTAWHKIKAWIRKKLAAAKDKKAGAGEGGAE